MTDVDRRWEGAAETGRADGSDSVSEQGGSCLVRIARSIRTFEVLKRTDHRKEAHGEDHRQKFPASGRAKAREQVAQREHRRPEMHCERLIQWLERMVSRQAQRPGDYGAEEHRREADRKAERQL